VRFVGPNIYGVYYTPGKMSAAFTTPYDVQGPVALASQSGGIGMGILGFSRSTKLGVSAIVGLGNKADIDEDDLLTFFEHDESTNCIALHMEDLKDGRAFVEVAQRVSQKKPIVVLKAGRHAVRLQGRGVAHGGAGRRRQGLRRHPPPGRRGPGQRAERDAAVRPLPADPADAEGENIVIITGAGGSGVLLSDACYNTGLHLMDIPDDLNEAFMKFIPPFGAAGNPVDITGGEPPETYRNTVALGPRGRPHPRAGAGATGTRS
jgi:acyl-CoA synthetase (NDP forming)